MQINQVHWPKIYEAAQDLSQTCSAQTGQDFSRLKLSLILGSYSWIQIGFANGGEFVRVSIRLTELAILCQRFKCCRAAHII